MMHPFSLICKVFNKGVIYLFKRAGLPGQFKKMFVEKQLY